MRISRLTALALLALSLLAVAPARAEPEAVYFPSGDGKTELTGYLFRPNGPGPYPAIVLLHGRAGPYSANYNQDCTRVGRRISSPCNGSTLSKRHAMWGEFWATRGVIALLPDSFGPRGKAQGFGRFTHGDPERDAVNELTVRPLDAEGAFDYLHSRKDVAADRIFLQGWSNGGSTALNVAIRQGADAGFRAAFVFYPGCGRAALLESTVKTSLPLWVFLGEEDEEVSPRTCQDVMQRSIDAGTKVNLMVYPGATHDFDDPGDKRQRVRDNQAAKADAMARAKAAIDRFSRP